MLILSSCVGCAHDVSEPYVYLTGGDYESGEEHYCTARGGRVRTGDGVPLGDCPFLADAEMAALAAKGAQ